jgi:hypothetical protein
VQGEGGVEGVLVVQMTSTDDLGCHEDLFVVDQ